MAGDAPLPHSAFVVLALLAEGATHGYALHKRIHTRGFRFWTSLRRSAVYGALTLAQRRGWVSSRVESERGPPRTVYRLTKKGRTTLAREALRHLTHPAHPHSELDLGVYALPFLPLAASLPAIDECLRFFAAREAFLDERLRWCRAQELALPALAFERPLALLRVEMAWLKEVRARLAESGAPPVGEWERYQYREPSYRKDR